MIRGTLALSALLVGCGSKHETVVLSTKTAVSADLVHQTGERWTDRGKVKIDQLYIRVNTSPEASVGTSCSSSKLKEVAIALDPKAERVAYRCAPGLGWEVFDLRKPPRAAAFRRCAPIQGDPLDWARVPTFEAARVSLMGCSASDGPAGMAQSFKELADESRARAGAKGVADLLGESLGVRAVGATDANGADEWDRTLATLSASERAPLTSHFKGALEAGANTTAVRRALLHGNLGDPALLDAMERAGSKIAAEPSTTDVETVRERTAALDVIVRTLLAKRPTAAAEVACTAASRFAANGVSRMIPREQLAAIVLAKKTCTLEGVFDRSVCQASYGCCAKGFVCADVSRRPCTAADLDALVKLEASRPVTNPWPGNNGAGSADELLVAAATVQGSNPAAQRFLERVKKVPTCGP